MRENKLAADDIAQRRRRALSPMTHVHCAWEYKAQGVTAAQMNLYYGLAVIALDGVAFTEQYRESRLERPAHPRLHRAHRSAYVDPEIEKHGRAVPPRRARESAHARRPQLREAARSHRRGSPENPLKPEEIEYKFRHVVSAVRVQGRRRPHRVDWSRRSRTLDESVGADRIDRSASSVRSTRTPCKDNGENMATSTYATHLAARFAALTLNDIDADIAHGGQEAADGLPRRRARRQPERKRRDRAALCERSTARSRRRG